MRTALLVACCTSLVAADRISESAVGLLMRPGLPKESGRVFLTTDAEFAAGIDDAPPPVLARDAYEGMAYEQREIGLGAAFTLRRSDTSLHRAYVGARHRELGGRPQFASGQVLPSRMRELSAGVSAKYLLDSNSAMSWRLGITSAADRPFAHSGVSEVDAELLYSTRFERGDAGYVGLFWNSRRVYPVPGAGYIWQATEGLRLTLGVPFSRIDWTLAEPWSLSAGGSPLLEEYEAKLAYALDPLWTLSFAAQTDGWKGAVADGVDRDHQIAYRAWRVGPRLDFHFKYFLQASLAGGWALGRRISEIEQADLYETVFHDDELYRDHIHLDDTWFLNLTLQMLF